MVYLGVLSGARRERLQTPLKSVAGAAFCGLATPGFSAVCANKMDEQTSVATAMIELTSRLRILKTPWWFGSLNSAYAGCGLPLNLATSIAPHNPHRAAPHPLFRWRARLSLEAC